MNNYKNILSKMAPIVELCQREYQEDDKQKVIDSFESLSLEMLTCGNCFDLLHNEDFRLLYREWYRLIKGETVRKFGEAVHATARLEKEDPTLCPIYSDQLQKGSVFYSSWGYEQTNIDFYIVTKKTAKTVVLLPLVGKRFDSGFDRGQTKPGLEIQWDEKPMRKKFTVNPDGSVYISLASYKGARMMNKNRSFSWSSYH